MSEATYIVTLAFAVTIDMEGLTDPLEEVLAENVEDLLSNVIGTESLAPYIETIEPVTDTVAEGGI